MNTRRDIVVAVVKIGGTVRGNLVEGRQRFLLGGEAIGRLSGHRQDGCYRTVVGRRAEPRYSIVGVSLACRKANRQTDVGFVSTALPPSLPCQRVEI